MDFLEFCQRRDLVLYAAAISAALLPTLISLSSALCHTGEDCVWNKDIDYPIYQPLILDSSFKLVLPVMKNSTREVR